MHVSKVASIFALSLLPGNGVALSLNSQELKNRPVSKVITLLKDMLKQLEKEADEDEEIYDKLACWCETNDKEKVKSIADAEDKIEELTHDIEKYTATSARLGTEIGFLNKEVAENQAALDKATKIRKKALAEFNAEEKDLLLSIQSLEQAIVVLRKPNGGALIQKSVLRTVMQKHDALLSSALPPSQRKAVLSFIQEQDFFDAEPTFKQSYQPQSGAIFGILQQMKETFESNLATLQKEEQEDQKTFEELKAAKESEIKAGQQQAEKKTMKLADTDENNVQAKTDLKDTKKTIGADQEFLTVLKETCQMTDKEWEERQKTRQLEMEAVSKALSFLSGDDAHDLFTKTFNPALLQSGSAAHSHRRELASKMLSAVANKVHSPRLSNLAYRVRLDAFTRVKKAIDDLVAELVKEMEDEVKEKDFCVEQLDKNKKATLKKERQKKDLTGSIEDMEATIKEAGETVDTLKSEIKEMQVQLKAAGENRDKENKEFQQTVADQVATQKLLKAALVVLEDFYGKKAAAAAALVQEPAGPPPPPGFEPYKKNAASGGVMGMIQDIIKDAKAMQAEATRAEEEGQKAYEDYVKETNASIEAKSKDIVAQRELKAKTEGNLVEANKEREAVLLELDDLNNRDTQLHQDCDFVLDNFDVRQKARAQEVEALRQANAILSGSNFKVPEE